MEHLLLGTLYLAFALMLLRVGIFMVARMTERLMYGPRRQGQGMVLDPKTGLVRPTGPLSED